MKDWVADVQAEVSIVIRDEHMQIESEDYSEARMRATDLMRAWIANEMRFADIGDYDVSLHIHLVEVKGEDPDDDQSR